MQGSSAPNAGARPRGDKFASNTGIRTEVIPPYQLYSELPLTVRAGENVSRARAEARAIVRGEHTRLLVVLGPCSIHDVNAALEYAHWLRSMQSKFEDSLFLVMRAYLEKPRTRFGWKGLVNDPFLDESFHINEGLRLARNLLLAITELGVPVATEFVSMVLPAYVGDLVSWGAIGARTAESQIHRELASGLPFPVGFKNNTVGNVDAAINGVLAARRPHHCFALSQLGSLAAVATAGNPDGHIVLRGGSRPNYSSEAVLAAIEGLRCHGLPDRLMIDCSHANCEGDYQRQVYVGECIASQLLSGPPHILGVMIESNLVEGSQRNRFPRPLVFGQSITDACAGLTQTEQILRAVSQSILHQKTFSLPAASTG
jgi:3-deoxy-7-phosphoheptulonate synthase